MVKKVSFIVFLIFVFFMPELTFGQNTKSKSDLSLKESKELYDKGSIDDALIAFEKLYDSYPNDTEICYYYGSCLVRNKIYPGIAIDVLLTASTGDVPVNVFYYLGKAFHLKYKFAEAELNFEKFKNRATRAEIQSMNIDLMDSMLVNAIKETKSVHIYDMQFVSTISSDDLDSIISSKSNGNSWQLMLEKLFTHLDKRYTSKYPLVQSKFDDKIYFSSYGPDAEFGKELYFIDTLELSGKIRPQTPGIQLSTKYAEINPVFTKNDSRLWYCSNGYGSMGGYDIFYSDLDSVTKNWKKPQNAGFPINSVYDEYLFLPNEMDSSVSIFSNRESLENSHKLIELKSIESDSLFIENSMLSDLSLFYYRLVTTLLKEKSADDFSFKIIDDKSGLDNSRYCTESKRDILFLRNYISYLDKLIIQGQSIVEEKEIISIKKKRESNEIKDDQVIYTGTKKGELNSTKSKLLAESVFLEEQSEFLPGYLERIEIRKLRLSEFLIASEDKLNIEFSLLSGEERLNIVNENRRLFNESADLYSNINQDSEIFNRAINSGIEMIESYTIDKKNLLNIIEKIEVELSNFDSLSYSDQNNSISKDDLEDNLREKNFRKEHVSERIKSLEDSQARTEKYKLFIDDFIKELENKGVLSYEFLNEYNSIEVEPVKIYEANSDGVRFDYDYSALDEILIIRKIDFNEEEIKQLGEADKLKFEADFINKKANKAKMVRQKLQEKLKDNKSKSKSNSIKKKIKKQDKLIFRYDLDVAMTYLSSYKIKYKLLSDKLGLYRIPQKNGFPDMELPENKSASFHKEAIDNWNETTKGNSKLIEPYLLSNSLSDSAYNYLMKVYYVYLNLAPVIHINDQIDEVKINEIAESNNSEVNQSVLYKPSDYSKIRNLIDYKLFFYTIQLGAFKTAQDISDFKGLMPVYEQFDGKLYRYFAGVYSSKRGAGKGRKVVVNGGFRDSYIVAFQNGKRLSSEKALELERSGNLERENEIEVVNMSQGGKPVVIIEDRTESGFYYTIQISVLSDDINNFDKFNLEPLFTHQNKDKFRITCGRYSTYESAVDDKINIVSNYYTDAFIIAFYKGVVLQINKAKILSGSGENVIFATPVSVRVKNKTVSSIQGRSVNNEIEYRIQIASYRSEPSAEEFKILEKYAGKYKLESFTNDNDMIIYTVGNFPRYNEAMVKRKEFLERGATEAFILAFKSGSKIPVNDAIRVTD